MRRIPTDYCIVGPDALFVQPGDSVKGPYRLSGFEKLANEVPAETPNRRKEARTFLCVASADNDFSRPLTERPNCISTTLTVLRAGCYSEVLPKEGRADQGQTGSAIRWSTFRCNL